MSNSKKSTSLFFSGVLILTFSNILIKIVGLVLKIPLHDIIGDEGMGYYNTAYEIYVWLYMISTAGLPVAVSIMISESRARGNFREAKRIFRIVLTLFLIIGTAGMSVMLLFNRQFAAAYQLNRANYCIMAIAPTLFFTCVSSSIRGYFQGYQNMLPTAVSQMIEAVCKLTLGVLMGRYAVSMGMENHVAAAYAITGVTIGVAAGMLFLCISKLTFRATVYDAEYVLPAGEPIPEPRATKTLLRQLIVLSVPIMISSSVMSFTSMLDSMIVSDRLHSLGYVESEIAAKLGNYKTLAVSLFNLPPALIYPISYSIVPLLAAANAKDGPERVRTIVQSSYKVAALIALPCSLGLSVLSKPILCLLFDEASADRAAPLLSLLSLSIFFIGMLAISNAVLQAHKKERLPIVSMLVGSVVKLAVSFVLVGNRNVEMFGAPIGTFMCYFAIVMVDLYFVAKHVHYIPSVKHVLVLPLISAVLCALAAGGFYYLLSLVLSGKIACILAILGAGVVYMFAVFLLGAVDEQDIMLLPKGEKLARFLRRIRLLRA